MPFLLVCTFCLTYSSFCTSLCNLYIYLFYAAVLLLLLKLRVWILLRHFFDEEKAYKHINNTDRPLMLCHKVNSTMQQSGKSVIQLCPLDKHSVLCCYLYNKPSILQLHCYCCYQVNSLCRSSDVRPVACSSKWVPLNNNNTSLCGCPWACERLPLETTACWGYAEWARRNCSVAPSSPTLRALSPDVSLHWEARLRHAGKAFFKASN